MPEPTVSVGAATLVMVGAAVPALTAFGVPLGLRADILLAGFFGALAAIVLLNSVPTTGDTWPELLRTTSRRAGVAMASAVTAGYLTPGLLDTFALSTVLACAFTVGAGAQKALALAIERMGGKPASGEIKP